MTNLRRMVLALAAALVTGGMAGAAGEAEEQGPPLPDLIAKGLRRWETIKTFRATFIRRERLEGKTQLGEKQVIFLRERRDPFSIYMHWLEGPGKDRKVAYVEGRNNGKFKVTPGGLLGWMVLDMALDDPRVYQNSRHMVTEAGMGPLLRRVDQQVKLSGADVITKYKGKAAFNNRPCYKFVRYMPQKPEYYCWKTEMLVDEELSFPLYLRLYDWQRNVFEEYSYADLEVDPDYTDRHFDIQAEKEPN